MMINRSSIALCLGMLLIAAESSAQFPIADINTSGGVDAIDIQFVINRALGQDVSYNCDVDNSGTVDSVDIQIAILAALSLPTPLDPCLTCLPWSDPATWGGTLPADGEELTIPADMHVLLDMDTPNLGGLTIAGSLVFDNADLALTSNWIMVHGSLQIGSEQRAYGYQAEITLTATNPAETIMEMGTRGIMVMGGTLELHGLVPQVPWTKLNAHADAGTSSLTLVEDPAWASGDQIALAPTDWYTASTTERFTIDAISGPLLTLDDTLSDPRWGLLQYATDTGMSLTPDDSIVPPDPATPLILDERAEVANLTRNIVIQAPDDTLWQTDGFGVHVMVMGPNSAAYIEGVEFRRAGQRGSLGRYPFHWHQLSYDGVNYLGDATGQYLRGSVVNESMNRGVVIHGTSGVTVQDNVIYNVRGHGLFTEDAVEQDNLIDGNLALHVRNPAPADTLKVHENMEDGGSSGYWIANPDNIVTNNTAADCQGFGFWLAFPDNPWGLNIGVPMRPSRIRFGTFENNTAHTSGLEGLMFDNVEINNDGTVFPFQYFSTTDEQDPQWNSGTLRRFTLSRFTAWKNRRGAIWDRVAWPDIVEVVAADNCGSFFAGSGADGVIEHCLLVGTSLNNATPRPSHHFPDGFGGDETPTGFATYHSAFDMRENVLVNFPLVSGERSGAFATEDYYIRPVDKGQMRNTDNTLIDTHPGYRSTPLFPHYALAGALWDPHGNWGPANNYFVYNSPFFTYGQTVTPVEPAGQTGGVSVPGPFYGILQFVINNDRPYFHPLMAIHATRLDPTTLAEVATWDIDEAQEGWLLSPMRHFAAHRDGIYTLEFPGHATPTDLEVRFENMLEDTDTLVLGVQFDGATIPDAVYTIAPGSAASVRAYAEVGSLQAVRDSAGHTYWRDTANDLIWVKLRGGSWEFWDTTGEFAIPTNDELLYETTILHINTD